MNRPNYLYKIISAKEWQECHASEQIPRGAIDTTFIHLATDAQLPAILQKFWSGAAYRILKLDTAKIAGRLVLEANPGGTTLFYHLYDVDHIDKDAIIHLYQHISEL